MIRPLYLPGQLVYYPTDKGILITTIQSVWCYAAVADIGGPFGGGPQDAVTLYGLHGADYPVREGSLFQSWKKATAHRLVAYPGVLP